MTLRTNQQPLRSAVVVASLAALFAARHAAAQPNIIHIIADDFGWVDLSAGATNYGHGSNYYQTPNIDELAARGMSFTSAYAQQNCQPTRAALLTGQYAPRNGVHNVGTLNRAGNDTLLVGPEDGDYVRNSAVTVAETLRSAEYLTAHFGKFHVAANRADVAAQHGFDVNMELANGASGTPHQASFVGGAWTFGQPEYAAYAQPYTQAYIDRNLAPLANGNNPNSLVGGVKHQADAMADAVSDFLATHAGGPTPFYMNVAFGAVHTPTTPRADLLAKYNAIPSADPRHDNAAYAAFVETLDQAVGRIVAAVDDPNGDGDPSDSVAANTLLLFYSDNGGHIGPTDNSPLRERKGTLREGGLRVPLIAVMPGFIAPNSRTDETVHAVDFYPTFAQLAGASLPDPLVHLVDGESFAGILAGQQAELNRDSIFWHFPGYLGDRAVPTSVVTKRVGTDRYKLSYFYEDAHYEFFNLTDDLGEQADLLAGPLGAADYEIARPMSLDLREWLLEQGAVYPTVRATGDPVPPPSPLAPRTIGPIVFDLRDPAAQGQPMHQIVQNGLTLSMTAQGAAAFLDRNDNGVGVNSAADYGGAVVQRRIDGTLATPESIQFSFDRDVILSSVLIGSIDTAGAESLKLSFVAGTNPFAALDGYDGPYQLDANALTFTPSNGAATPLTVPFGAGAQDALILPAGTVLALTANPATDGGILFDAITVEELAPALPGDFDGSGQVNAADLAQWQGDFGFNDGSDADYDGDSDGADFLAWQQQLGMPTPSTAAVTAPEPTAGVMLFGSLLAILGCKRCVTTSHLSDARTNDRS